MLLTITTTHSPATDLGYLLYKNPSRVQQFTLACGQAHVFYPEASPQRCTIALLLELDPVGLVRRPAGFGLEQYVNDRPYVASSFLSIAIAQVFGSALGGKCRDRPDLVDQALPLEVQLAVVPCRGGEGLLRDLFEPLGYRVTAQNHPLDAQFPEWGASPYFTVTLEAECTVQALLGHLYVLIPVLDDDKHYWVGADEVDKLLRHGETWLATHPKRDLIAYRYLKHRSYLTRQALAQLTPEEAQPVLPDAEDLLEKPLSLNEQRLNTVLAVLKQAAAKRIVDLGCGEGNLLRRLLADPSFEHLTGMDVSYRALEIARDRLHWEDLPPLQRERITLLQGSLTYHDHRLVGYDAATVIEVIEHLDPHRLQTFERVLFERIRATTVVLTTPNADYNQRFTNLAQGQRRHHDHRFEWTRAELQAWAQHIAQRFGYQVRFLPIGAEDPDLGAPTQMAVFTLLTGGTRS